VSKYCVTGGAGFIGSHLCDLLVEQGHDVLVLDNLSTGKKENLNKQAKLIEGDIRDLKLLKDVLKNVDGCFHLAAIVSVVECAENWPATHEVNALGTIDIFQTIHQLKTHIPVVYASSCAVYGEQGDEPLSEMQGVEPLSPYGADKLSCEIYADVANQLFHISNIGLRIFNVYGPRQDPNSPYSGVISRFMKQLTENKPVTIFGDGEQVRDFVYVKDVVAFLYQAMQMLHQKNVSGVYNVCTGITTSINDLAKLMAEVLNKPLKLDYQPARPADIIYSCGDPRRAAKVLDIKTKFDLRSGLIKF